MTAFIGRSHELDELRALFLAGKRLVTLVGIGGIGKTRLALELGLGAGELHLRLLRGGHRPDPRHQTIRASLDWSHALLTDRERQLFARLSVFSGGFDLTAAAAVCGDADGPAETLGDVEGLVDKSLLAVERKAGATRFLMLDFVRQYAAERLVAARDRGRAVGVGEHSQLPYQQHLRQAGSRRPLGRGPVRPRAAAAGRARYFLNSPISVSMLNPCWGTAPPGVALSTASGRAWAT